MCGKIKIMDKVKRFLSKYLKKECDDKYGSFHVCSDDEKDLKNGSPGGPPTSEYVSGAPSDTNDFCGPRAKTSP